MEMEVVAGRDAARGDGGKEKQQRGMEVGREVEVANR